MSTEPAPEADAYALLSRPTLDYTDEEVAAVVADLRRRRAAFLSTGKVDKPVKKAAEKGPPGPKADAAEKARNTALLLSQLKIPGMEPKP